jgi:SAM-dependent methyltransferase
LSAQDEEESLPSAIYNVYTPKQQWERMWTGRTLEQEVKHCEYRELRNHLLDVLGQMEDPFVVEAGCGVGAWVAFLSKNGVRRVVGVDNYAPALEELKRHVPAGLVMESDVRDLPLANDSVDACISLGVVEHFPDGPTSLILEMFRVLRPGGYLFLTVPYYNLFRRLFIHPLRAAFLSAKSRIRKCKLYFVEYRFTRNEVAEIVRECGFEVVKVTTDDYEPTDLALGLFVDLPLFRGDHQWSLNFLGRFVRWSACHISPWLTTGGVLLLARKPVSVPVNTAEPHAVEAVA